MPNKSVLLLMSGGVDSSAAGALLIEQGFDLVGVTMKQLDAEPTRGQSSGCCSFGDVRDAKKVAAALQIPHYTINTAPEFHRRVIQPFINSYQMGMTPNPCVHCNSFVRYEEAFDLAKEWDCEWVATGHYAKLERDGQGEPHLSRASYREKDQSYYLYGIRKELLKRIVFPLGGKTKSEVRAIAKSMGLVTAEKPESQEICFTLGRTYNEFLADHIESEEGPILDRDGNTLGTHAGITNYTVGQRKGIGLTGGPFYVLEIDVENNAVIVGRKDDLGMNRICATAARWIHEPSEGETVLAQIRSRHTPSPAKIVSLKPARIEIEFDETQYGVAPGQALVISRGDEILGGGVIQKPQEFHPQSSLPIIETALLR